MSNNRRQFSRDFKVEAVRLVTEGGQSVAEAARKLGVTANLLGRWKQQANTGGRDAFPGKGRLAESPEPTSAAVTAGR